MYVKGDIRLAPFYDITEVQRAVEAFVAEINADPSIIETPDIHGPHSKYQLPDGGAKGSIELKWVVEVRRNRCMHVGVLLIYTTCCSLDWQGENGVACKLDSRGYEALIGATKSVLGDAKPYAIGGSLPLIRSLQEQGFDVQISGYGASAK
jgi:acetylornithine deacetylase